MRDQTPDPSELGMELDLLSEEEAIPADGDLGISRPVTPMMGRSSYDREYRDISGEHPSLQGDLGRAGTGTLI